MTKVTINVPNLKGTYFDKFYKEYIYSNIMKSLLNDCIEYSVKDNIYNISFSIDAIKKVDIHLMSMQINDDIDIIKDSYIEIKVEFEEEIYYPIPKDELTGCRKLFNENNTAYKIPIELGLYPDIAIDIKDKYTMIDINGNNFVKYNNECYKVINIDKTKYTLKEVFSGKITIRTNPEFTPLTRDELISMIQDLNNDKVRTYSEMLSLILPKPTNLRFIKEQTPDICITAVKEDGQALQYVKEQTPDICLEAVKKNGFVLAYVKEQTPDICLEAVKQNGLALKYVKDQTEDICIEAVKQNGWALQFVKEQTEDICLEAVKKNGLALAYVKEQTPDICITAVKEDGQALQYVKEQTSDICLEAIKQNNKVLKYVYDEFVPDIIPYL